MDAILQESHKTRWLEAGWYLALQFSEGHVVFRIKGREFSNMKPFSLGAVAAGANLAAWTQIQDAQARFFLMPQSQGFIYHHFWGITPPKARGYIQYEPTQDVGNLLSLTRGITLANGNIGYVNGDMSPYEGPYSPETELFTVFQKYPAFNVLNPVTDAMANVKMAFETMKYSYTIVTNQATIKSLLVGNQKVKKYTMGRVDPDAIKLPQWLTELVPKSLLEYTNTVMEAIA
jgi:hypothetical protein